LELVISRSFRTLEFRVWGLEFVLLWCLFVIWNLVLSAPRGFWGLEFGV
jgi:hypothetical protein